jgi:hypothetical protein
MNKSDYKRHGIEIEGEPKNYSAAIDGVVRRGCDGHPTVREAIAAAKSSIDNEPDWFEELELAPEHDPDSVTDQFLREGGLN